MFQEQINQAVNEISNLQDMQAADLKLIIDRYPYFQAAHVLYAKKLHSINHPAFEKQLQKTSAIIIDRNILFEIIENTPLHAKVAAGFEDDIKEEIIPQQEIKTEELIHEIELHEHNNADEKPDEHVMISEDISQEELDHLIADSEHTTDEKQVDEHLQKEINTLEIVNTAEEKNEVIEEIIAEEEIKSTDAPIEIQEIQIAEEDKQEQIEKINVEEEIKSPETVMELQDIQRDEPVVETTLIDEKPEPLKDEPIFEMPGYNIERELGTLDEAEAIRIDIRKPVITEDITETTEEAAPALIDQQHEFAAWFTAMGMANKAKVVELPASFNPVLRLQPEEETGEMTASVEADSTTETAIPQEAENEKFAGELAKRSLQFDDRLVSETYARILYMQGKYAKAVEMYEKLSLLKPAKSDYFAALIEQIKKRK